MRLNFYDKEILHRIRDMITANPQINYSISQLAAEAAMSETRLKLAFKQLFNITIHRFSIQSKMQLAKQLIEEDKKTLAQIAKMIGFSSLTNFSTAFKRIHGRTPGSYRPR
jgi:AraC-like DNA-binding protein